MERKTNKIDSFVLFKEYSQLIYISFAFVIGGFIYFIDKNPTSLYLGGTTPWGIITSIFVYDGLSNITSFYLLASLYIFSTIYQTPLVRAQRSTLIVKSSYFVPVFVNVLWFARAYNVNGAFSYGQSGIIYAYWGIITFFSLVSFFEIFFGWRKIKSNKASYDNKEFKTLKTKNYFSLFFDISILILTFGLLTNPTVFFNMSKGVNYFVHVFSFLGGIAIGDLFMLLDRFRALKTKKNAKSTTNEE